MQVHTMLSEFCHAYRCSSSQLCCSTVPSISSGPDKTTRWCNVPGQQMKQELQNECCAKQPSVLQAAPVAIYPLGSVQGANNADLDSADGSDRRRLISLALHA